MRRGTKIFIFLNLVSITLLVHTFSTLIALLFETGLDDAIPASEIQISDDYFRDLTKEQEVERGLVVPRILHQTYKTREVPEKWVESQRSCLEEIGWSVEEARTGVRGSRNATAEGMMEDWDYMLWTDESSAKFIEEHYPWFLPTFVSYPFPIQRADAIRYFILHHYGGIYLDLDDGCARSLDVMRRYPAWLRRTLPTGISNDAMGAVKGHAFFAFVTTKLESFNRSYGMPYITVMSSTGPLFLSILWKQWKRELAAAAARAATGSDAGGLGHTLADKVAVLMPPEYKGNEWSIFRIAEGSSWHGGDAKAIFWMGKHWLLLVVAGFAVAGVVFAAMWWCWSSCGKVGTVKVGGGGVPGWGRVKALGAWVKRRVVGRRRGYIKIERSDEESRCE